MPKNPSRHVELHDSPALQHYADWRPRLKRGLTWAGTAAFLSKTMGGNARTIIPATLGAGVAGAADAVLEDKLRAAQHQETERLLARGFEERKMPKIGSAQDPSLFPSATVAAAELQAGLLLTGLSRMGPELQARAVSQLKDCFPQAAADEAHYGRGVRVTTGHGTVAQLLARAR